MVDTRSGEIEPHRSVPVEDGKIVSVLAANASAPAGIRRIDASGKFAVPGFTDMHIHLTELTRQSSTAQKLMLANGIILAREESTTPEIEQKAEELNASGSASMDHLGAGRGLIPDCSTQADAIRESFWQKATSLPSPRAATSFSIHEHMTVRPMRSSISVFSTLKVLKNASHSHTRSRGIARGRR